MGLNVKEKSIVVPGDILATGMDNLPAEGTFREDDNIIASQVGLVSINGRLIKVIPLNGAYNPKAGDVVIGKIVEMSYSSWFVDIGYAYDANLTMKDATSDFIERGADLSKYFDFGELIMTKITNVTGTKAIDLTMKGPGLRKLQGGRIIVVSPVKIPRIIGKQASMISMIKDKTKCQILAGQNGRVWISGKNTADELLAEKAILLIEAEAHKPGLTDRMKAFLENGGKK